MNIKPLPRGSTIALLACSESLREKEMPNVENLVNLFQAWGLRVQVSPLLKQGSSWSHPAKDRAEILMDAFCRSEVSAILDPSGGESANEILEFLDYDKIRLNPKPFFGHSDISVLLNGLFKMAEIPTWHFQPLNLVGPFSDVLSDLFSKVFITGERVLEKPGITMLRGDHLQGPLVGGNIRCLLKLAGTRYWPDFNGRILLLESFAAEGPGLSSLLSHLDHLGVFSQIAGILLGTFTLWEKKVGIPSMEELTLNATEHCGLPVGKTKLIGHGRDAVPVPFHVPFI